LFVYADRRGGRGLGNDAESERNEGKYKEKFAIR
jgi:hypothetical protein